MTTITIPAITITIGWLQIAILIALSYWLFTIYWAFRPSNKWGFSNARGQYWWIGWVLIGWLELPLMIFM
jgi:hypothetical protein